MKTFIEEDSPMTFLVLLLVVLLVLFVGGLGLAYWGGVFTGKSEVAANDKRIVDQASVEHRN